MRHIWVTALVVVSCTGDPEVDPEQVSAASIMSNSMSNSIMSNALTANRLASNILIGKPLPQALADPYVFQQLWDPAAWNVLPYLISCAVGAGDSITVRGPTRSQTYSGSLGLARSWMTAPLDTVGQQRVSGCLLARVNAYGHGVLLSFRCEPAAICTNALESTPNPVYPYTNTRVASLTPSTIGANYDDIGWSLDRIGTCAPASAVSVSTYDYGGAASGAAVLRACPGVHACDAAESISSVTNTPWNGRDQLRFDCPAEGTFSILKAPRIRAVPVTIKTGAKQFSGKFPAPEGWQAADRAIFTWPEGVFFGNIFGSASFNKDFLDNTCDKYGYCRHPTQTLGLVVFNAYAAASDVWTDDKAYMHERLCAGIQQNCVAKPLGRARQVCSILDGFERMGDGDYQKCKGSDGVTYTTGSTIFLDNPCAVVLGACGTVSPTP